MKVQFAILRDIIVMLVFFIITVLLTADVFGGPVKRGFFPKDESISLPYTESEAFNPVALVAYGFFFPIVVLIITWFAIDKVHLDNFDHNDVEEINPTEEIEGIPLLSQNQYNSVHDTSPLFASNYLSGSGENSSGNNGRQTMTNAALSPHYTATHWGSVVTPTSTPRSRKLRFILYQFMILCLVALVCVFVTNVMKSMTGRLRPDFMSRCNPDFKKPGLPDFPDHVYIPAHYHDILCTGDSSKINDGRKSFPSGHSSSSMTGGLFVAILLFKRCWNRGRRALGSAFIPICCVISISGALIIAVSRSSDYRHHALDISVGVLIGVLSALGALCFDMFTPSWEKDGSILKNSTTQEAITLTSETDNV